MHLDRLPVYGALRELAGVPFSIATLCSETTCSDTNGVGDRASDFTCEAAGWRLDYSRSTWSMSIKAALLQLTEEAALSTQRGRLFAGSVLNTTENRPVQHTLLRSGGDFQDQTRIALSPWVAQLHAGALLGEDGTPIDTILHIGIGGSGIGCRMVAEALSDYRVAGSPTVYFLDNIGSWEQQQLAGRLRAASTLCIVASKSFATEEVLLLAGEVRRWFAEQGVGSMARHIVAVTACADRARAWGASQVMTFASGIGGRFSIWSTAGLGAACCIGYDRFAAFLGGAHAMDEHFLSAPMGENMPVLLALMSVWYTTFLGAQTEALIAYDSRLTQLIPYVQQLSMESNGKSVGHDGEPLGYQTAPVLWGGVGTQAQHTFFQLLHQGTVWTPCDLIAIAQPPVPIAQQRSLVAHAFAQAEALAYGTTATAAYAACAGNKPTNVLLTDALTPERLGALLALYEHKVFTAGVLWGVCSFDQWGVELGKRLAGDVRPALENAARAADLRGITQRLVRWYQTLLASQQTT